MTDTPASPGCAPARVLGATAALLASVLLGAACTVPNNDRPVELSGPIPSGLLEKSTTTSTSEPEAVTKQVPVYLLRNVDSGGAQLVEVTRNVDVGADIEEVLANLFTVRPDPEERPEEAGLTTAIPESAMLLSAELSDSGRLVVDVRGIFGNEGIANIEQRNALAQIVWTATADDAVEEVGFESNGQSVPALVDDGEIIEGAVTRADYSRST